MKKTTSIRNIQSDAKIGDLFFMAKSETSEATEQNWSLVHPALKDGTEKVFPIKLRVEDAVASMEERSRIDASFDGDNGLAFAAEALVYRNMLDYGLSGFHTLRAHDKRNKDVQRFRANLNTVINVVELHAPEAVAQIDAVISNSYNERFGLRMGAA